MKSEVQVFEIVQTIGMFATLSYCALLAKACEEKGKEPYIVASSRFYLSPTPRQRLVRLLLRPQKDRAH